MMAKVIWAPPGMQEAAQQILDSTGDRMKTEAVPHVLVWSVGSEVEIGYGESKIEGQITGIIFRAGNRVSYEVSWWNGRSHECKWLEAFEVKPVDMSKATAIGFQVS